MLRTAKLNGLSIVIIAGICALGSLAFGDWVGAGYGVLVVAGGWLELSGRKQLLRGNADGMRRLVRSQMVVLSVILIYAVSRIGSFDLDTALGGMTAEMRTELTQSGVDLNSLQPMVRLMFYALYIGVIVGSVIYQGGMALYYQRRTEAVKRALAARLRPAIPSPVLKADPEDWVT